MDRSVRFYLLATTYITDEIGQRIPAYVRRGVFGAERSVTRAEWSAAGERGLKPDRVLVMFGPDYEGEELIQMETGQDGVLETFSVYRTYRRLNDEIELYVERKAGETDPEMSELYPIADANGHLLFGSDGRMLVLRGEADG